MAKLKVDMQRRNKLRRLHTATHIINYCARKVLGNHVWQNGSNLKPEVGTLDITHYENVTQEELFAIEKMANEVVFDDRKVSIEELPRDQAEKKYGYSLYQGGAIPMTSIRIIHVLDNDIEACGGTHMETTGGIGLIKLIDSQKIQDGVVRLSYVVGEFAVEYVQQQEMLLGKVQDVFNVGSDALIRTSEKFFKEWKEQKKEIDDLKENLKGMYLDLLKDPDVTVFEVAVPMDMGMLMDLFTSVLKQKKSFKLISSHVILATVDHKIKEEYKKKIDKGAFSMYILQ